jgi:lipopolysaccharide export system protein LptA
MSHTKISPTAFAAVLFLMAGIGAAAAQQAVDIVADEMEIRDGGKQTVFKGNVIAKREKEVITCPEMVITNVDVKQADGTTQSEADVMDCTGTSVITTATQRIVGQKAKLYIRKDELVVSGDVVVREGKTLMRGQELTTDLKTKRTVMKGGRVRGTFVPK